MKKIFFSLALLFCMCIGAMAQTKVDFIDGTIGVDWKFKRSFLNGNTLVVDFVVENNTSQDISLSIMYRGCPNQIGWFNITAYDDEGNVYTNDLVGGHFSGKMGSKNSLFATEMIPTGNLIKVRMQIAGIDEYATQIKTLLVPIQIVGADYSALRVTNIPIPRE